MKTYEKDSLFWSLRIKKVYVGEYVILILCGQFIKQLHANDLSRV